MKKVIKLFLCLAMVFSLLCGSLVTNNHLGIIQDVNATEITGVSMQSTACVYMGDTLKLTATVEPANTTEDKTILWYYQNNGVLALDKTGLITPVKPGKAEVYAYSTNNKSATCVVYVVEADHKHDYKETVIKEATSTVHGSKKLVCDSCGYNYIATVHYAIKHEGEPATCEEDGYTSYSTCGICGLMITRRRIIKATGHNFETVAAVSPTCTTAGHNSYDACKNCGEIDGNVFYYKPLGHEEVEILPVRATCTEEGLSGYIKCERCQAHLTEAKVIEPTGHNYESEITVQPTETTEGVRTYTCTRCEDSYTKPIPKKSHKHTTVEDPAVAATCTTAGSTKGTHCKTCGQVLEAPTTIEALGHNYKETKVDPTTTTEGYTLHACTRCTYSYKDNYVPKLSEASELPFVDVPKGKWFYNSVKEAYELGLMTGTDKTHFDPYKNMTRGMVATVLYRIAGKPAVKYDGHFPDVPNGKYYSEAVTWCYQNGVVQGNKDGTFKPSNNITRQELAIMLKNFAACMGKPGKAGGDLSVFADQTTISGWAKDAVAWAVGNEVIGGKKVDGKLYVDPKANATRAECAKMLLTTYNLIYK